MSKTTDPRYLAETIKELRLQLKDEENRTDMWFSIAQRLSAELKRQRAAMRCLQNISRRITIVLILRIDKL